MTRHDHPASSNYIVACLEPLYSSHLTLVLC